MNCKKIMKIHNDILKNQKLLNKIISIKIKNINIVNFFNLNVI